MRPCKAGKAARARCTGFEALVKDVGLYPKNNERLIKGFKGICV